MPATNVPAANGTVLDHVGLFVPDMTAAIIAIEHQIAALAERYEPLSELWWHLIDSSPDLWVAGKRPDAQTNGAHSSPCRIGILRCQEVMKPLDVM